MAEAYSQLLQSDPRYYGGIVVCPRIQPAINDNFEDGESSISSQESWVTVSEWSLESDKPVLQEPRGYTDTETPGQRAPSRHGRGDLPIEQGRVTCGECCKCCKSWDDWCLFLSCNCSSSLHLPMHERKCLRAARTEGWRLLWSFLLPLTVGSVPLQLVWAIAQSAVAIALLLEMVFDGNSFNDSLESFGTEYIFSLSCSAVWLFISIVDTTISITMSRFYHKILVTKFSVYVTPLRIFYTSLCLLLLILSNSLQKFNYTYTNKTTCVTNWGGNKVWLYFSITSFFFFVDFMCLVIVVLFALKSLKVRNAYSQAIGGPGKREGIRSFECYIVLCVLGEVIMHVLLVLFTCTLALKGHIKLNNDPDSCNDDINQCTEYLITLSQMSAVFSLIVPLAGIVSIYYNIYFYFQKYLINVYLSVCHLSQDRERAAQLNIPADVFERLRERQLEMQDINYAESYLENFEKEFKWSARVTHPCFNPFTIISAILVNSLLITFISWNVSNLYTMGNYPDECTDLLLMQVILVPVLFGLIHPHIFFAFLYVFVFCIFGCCLWTIFPIPCMILLYCCCYSTTCRCEKYVDSIP